MTILVFRVNIRGWADFFAVLSTIRGVKNVDDGTFITFELHDRAFTNTLHLPWTWWMRVRLLVYALVDYAFHWSVLCLISWSFVWLMLGFNPVVCSTSEPYLPTQKS